MNGERHDWPALRVDDWTETRQALHLWSQVIGKVKLAKTPLINHWWNVTFAVSPRGLTTGSMPDGHRIFQIDFDMVDQVVRIETLGGEHREIELRPMSVATFYSETMDALQALGIDAEIMPVPVELEVAVPFLQDTAVRSYDGDQARTFWLQLVQASRVLLDFRAGFIGKVSPVHFFWGGFDLAVTRFSGREAPPHPGGAPNCPDWVMLEGYSHEVSSCGFWAGGGDEGAFYSYAYPEPAGFATARVRPSQAGYSDAFKQFLLPYEAVRTSDDPEATVRSFLQDTYDAAASFGGWDPSLSEGPLLTRIRPHL